MKMMDYLQFSQKIIKNLPPGFAQLEKKLRVKKSELKLWKLLRYGDFSWSPLKLLKEKFVRMLFCNFYKLEFTFKILISP